MSTENEKKATHAVLYTDGGSRPPRNSGGWGLHGYLFREEAAKQGTGCPNALPTRRGYVMGGSGMPEFTITHYVDGFGAMLPEATNNQAEIMGAIKALEIVKDHDIKDVTLMMDSQYALQGMAEWSDNWARANWIKPDGREVSNADLWRRCHAAKQLLQDSGVQITYQWVKAHNGELGNHQADRLATRAVFAARRGDDQEHLAVVDAKGYWGYAPERSRMFSHPNWYFAAGATESYQTADGRHVYYLGDPREDEELTGKKIAQATFSVVYLTKPEPILTMLRDTVAKAGGDQYQALTIGYLRTIFKPSVYQDLEMFGERMVNVDVNNHRLTLWDHQEKNIKGEKIDSVLTKDIRPARLAYRAIEALQSLERILQEYLNPSPNSQIRCTDITGLLYEGDASKKKTVLKLKPHITSATRSVKVDAGYVSADGSLGTTKVCLTLSLDTPDRNTLAALAGEDTKVTLLTWPEPESIHAIRYAVVIEADGDVGIWSGIYANLHMLTAKP